MTLKVRYRGGSKEYPATVSSPERAALLLVRRGPREGDGCVEVIDESREVMWVFTPEDLQRLQGGAKTWKWGWWTPYDRPAYVFYDAAGRVIEVGPILSADEVICDVCNALVLVRPVPLIGGMAVCRRCFQRIAQISLAEAAARDGVVLETLDPQEG